MHGDQHVESETCVCDVRLTIIILDGDSGPVNTELYTHLFSGHRDIKCLIVLLQALIIDDGYKQALSEVRVLMPFHQSIDGNEVRVFYKG